MCTGAELALVDLVRHKLHQLRVRAELGVEEEGLNTKLDQTPIERQTEPAADTLGVLYVLDQTPIERQTEPVT